MKVNVVTEIKFEGDFCHERCRFYGEYGDFCVLFLETLEEGNKELPNTRCEECLKLTETCQNMECDNVGNLVEVQPGLRLCEECSWAFEDANY